MVKSFCFSISILLFLGACKPKLETTSPTYQMLTEAVYASGNIYPQYEYKVFANADGYLLKQLVEEGDIIKSKQLLFVLESDQQNARSEAATNIYRQSEANLASDSPILREAEAQLKATRIRFRNDSINLERYKNLNAQNIGTQIDFDRAKLAFETTQEELEARKNALKRIKNQLFVELQNARSAYRINSKESSNYTVLSFEEGKVYEIYKKLGEMVRRTEPIALIGSAKNLFAQLAIDETDFNKVKIGQDVIIKTDVYEDKVFKAKISKIFPKLNRADQSFRVDATFIGEAPAAYYGLTVEANIIISQNPKTLTIPKTFLYGNDSVWVMQNEKPTKTKIVRGTENFEIVEIKSGLTDKSVVVKMKP